MKIGRLVSVCVYAGIVLPDCHSNAETSWFGGRLLDQFAADLRAPAYNPPSAESPASRRISFTPFDSPPFPSGDWQIAGTPIIGDAGNVGPWPLMEAIYATPTGDWWKKSRFQIYGWEDFSFNLSTSNDTSRSPDTATNSTLRWTLSSITNDSDQR